MGSKIPVSIFECFLLRLELDNVAVRRLESAKYIGIEAKFREGAVRVGGQDTSNIFVPLIISDPAEVG